MNPCTHVSSCARMHHEQYLVSELRKAEGLIGEHLLAIT